MKSFMSYFPKQLGYPERTKPINDSASIFREVNKYNGIRTCFWSVYNCNEFGLYDKCIIDKAVIDFDFKEKSQEFIKIAIPILKDKGWRHTFMFSGNKGFHLYVFCKPSDQIKCNKKDVLFNIQMHIIDTLKIPKEEIDPTLLSDITQLIRVPNTLHLKSNLYAIPVSHDDLLNLSFQEIREKAKQPQMDMHIYGNKLLNVLEYDYASRKREIEIPEFSYNNTTTLDDSEIDKIVKKFHPCVQMWLVNPTLCKNMSRFYFAVYCRDLGISPEMTLKIAEKFWKNIPDASGRKTKFLEFKQEKQIEYSHKKTDFLMPNCDTLYSNGGFCLGKCKDYKRHNFPLYR